MKVYLAGPMSGIPYFNHPAFNAAAKELRDKGHEVFNPAELGNTTYGDKAPASGNVEEAVAGYGFDYKECLKMDLAWIFDNAEAIALLPGWEKSKGVTAELALARALGLKLMLLSTDGQQSSDYYAELSEQTMIRESTIRTIIITHMFNGMPVTV